MWFLLTVTSVVVSSVSTVNSRVLYSYDQDSDPVLTRYNSSNDVTEWDPAESGKPGDQSAGRVPGIHLPTSVGYDPAGVRTRDQQPMEVVVSLLQSMTEEVQSLRGQMANVKYQNHLIYKQLKRINNRCTATPAPKVKTRSCPRDFVYNEQNGQCYKFSTDRITWRMSREKCRNIGADLITIDSVRMHHFITDMARKNKELRHCDFWIGANDQEREGTWKWVADSSPITYANWNHNEPNNGSGDEHCAMMLWVFNWSWNDARCKYDNACYICQTPMQDE